MNSPRRVLYVHHDSTIGGASNSLLALLAGLDRDRFHPFVTLPGPGPMAEMVHSHGVETIYVPTSTFFHMEHFVLKPWHAHIAARSLATAPKASRWICDIVRSLDVSLVHVNSSMLIASAVGAKHAGVPVVWHVREIISRGHLGIRHQLIRQLIASNADAVLAVSQAVAARLPRDSRVHVVHNGIDAERFCSGADGGRVRSELAIPARSPLVGYISPAYGAKGCYDFVTAARIIKRHMPKAEFLVAGKTPPKQLLAVLGENGLGDALARRVDGWRRMERMAKDYGLGECFHFLGHRSDSADLFSAIDILLFPSVGEALGRVLLEAGAIGCPSVCYDSRGTPEIVQNGATGMLVPAGDAVALARAGESLLEDRPRALALARASTERIKTAFGLDSMVSAIERVYTDLL